VTPPQAYTAGKVPPTGDALQSILDVVTALPPVASEESAELEECGRLIAAALKWAHQ
jgi:hypothetical protein